MKKNIKTIASLAFVALLAASCDGSAITKEEAQKRAKNMADHEATVASEVLEKGVHFSLKVKSVVKEVKTNASMNIYFADNYFHVSLNAKTEGENVNGTVKGDVYFGQKENEFYVIDATNKQYAVLESKDAASLLNSIKNTVDEILDEGSSTSLLKMLDNFPESSSTTELGGLKHTYEMKSKGEGHLCLKSTTSYTGKDEDKKNETVTKLVVENYRFASLDSSTAVLGSSTSIKVSAKYSISKSLPSVSGMEKVASVKIPDLDI